MMLHGPVDGGSQHEAGGHGLLGQAGDVAKHVLERTRAIGVDGRKTQIVTHHRCWLDFESQFARCSDHRWPPFPLALAAPFSSSISRLASVIVSCAASAMP